MLNRISNFEWLRQKATNQESISLFCIAQDMGPSPAKKVRGQGPGKGGKGGKACKGEGLDGRWMLKLVYPNAATLGAYLEAWLRDIAAASPTSSSATAIDSFGGPASYLSRRDDQPEFEQVRGGWRELFDCGFAVQCSLFGMAGARDWLGGATAICRAGSQQMLVRYFSLETRDLCGAAVRRAACAACGGRWLSQLKAAA